jgi:hypothetical protein
MKKGQEPAFPQPLTMDQEGNMYSPREKNILDCGMSTRLYLAGMILQGIMASKKTISLGNSLGSSEVMCALMVTDELIKQEEETHNGR